MKGIDLVVLVKMDKFWAFMLLISLFVASYMGLDGNVHLTQGAVLGWFLAHFKDKNNGD